MPPHPARHLVPPQAARYPPAVNRRDDRWSARRGRTPAPLSVLALSLGLALASCRALGASSANLDVLHGEGARHKHVAPLVSPFKYSMARVFGGRVFRPDSPLFAVKEEPIQDAATVCLENMLGLAADEPRNAAEEATVVRHYAYLAMADPWSLTRERALIELGYAGERLELEGPIAEPQLAANAPELSEAIAGLVAVTGPLIGGRGSTTEHADFTAAIGVIESMVIDVDGGRRLLKAIAGLSERVGRSSSIEALDRLNRHVQRRMVGLALTQGLRDPNGRARAAAYEANWRVYGDPFLRAAIIALDVSSPDEEAPATRFDLAKEWYTYPGQEDVYVTVLELVREHGLPLDAGLEPRRSMLQRFSFLRTMCQITVAYTAHGDRSRTSAMRALGAVSDSGIESLRMEDWQRWWGEFSRAQARWILDGDRADSEESP